MEDIEEVEDTEEVEGTEGAGGTEEEDMGAEEEEDMGAEDMEEEGTEEEGFVDLDLCPVTEDSVAVPMEDGLDTAIPSCFSVNMTMRVLTMPSVILVYACPMDTVVSNIRLACAFV